MSRPCFGKLWTTHWHLPIEWNPEFGTTIFQKKKTYTPSYVSTCIVICLKRVYLCFTICVDMFWKTLIFTFSVETMMMMIYTMLWAAHSQYVDWTDHCGATSEVRCHIYMRVTPIPSSTCARALKDTLQEHEPKVLIHRYSLDLVNNILLRTVIRLLRDLPFDRDNLFFVLGRQLLQRLRLEVLQTFCALLRINFFAALLHRVKRTARFGFRNSHRLDSNILIDFVFVLGRDAAGELVEICFFLVDRYSLVLGPSWRTCTVLYLQHVVCKMQPPCHTTAISLQNLAL